MKLMTYNILNGGNGRLQQIVDIIKRESPDYLTINEANTFAKDQSKLLKEISQQIALPHFELALSGEHEFHLAVFSKYPFKETHTLAPLMRTCLVALVKTEIGLLSIASLHLTPYSEDLRHPEIDLILDFQKGFENRVLMGDMNSLSKYDGYDPRVIKQFNEIQRKKFTTNGEFRFDAIEKMQSVGYYDTALELHKNRGVTAPTDLNNNVSHFPSRLDYIFVSKSLLPRVVSYAVIKNPIVLLFLLFSDRILFRE